MDRRNMAAWRSYIFVLASLLHIFYINIFLFEVSMTDFFKKTYLNHRNPSLNHYRLCHQGSGIFLSYIFIPHHRSGRSL